jgi:hypothetical protein
MNERWEDVTMKHFALTSLVVLSMLSMNAAIAEGDEAGNPPRPRIGTAPGVIAPGAIRAITNVTRVGSITCQFVAVPLGEWSRCSNKGSYGFNSEGSDLIYGLKLQAPSTHCAPMTYSIVVDGRQPERSTSRSLNAGESEIINIGSDWARGRHQVLISASSIAGQGCNRNGLQSWAVDASVVIIPR